jgi:hypothetical protein
LPELVHEVPEPKAKVKAKAKAKAKSERQADVSQQEVHEEPAFVPPSPVRMSEYLTRFLQQEDQRRRGRFSNLKFFS